MQRFILFLLIVIASTSANAQVKPSYHPPLAIPLILAGNFGELRPNHFHMGLDFKTQGKEGFPLHSIEDGFISRVKISTYGYGKAVYIDHPDGHTSVYAHCSKLLGKLDSIVKAEQKRLQRFEVELFFDSKQLPIKKGEAFALSGNTGGSTAPHLHFEIRDTQTEVAKNPLIYAFDMADTRPPEIRKMKVFAVNEQGYLVPGKAFEKTLTQLKSGGVKLAGDTLVIPANYTSSFGGVGLAFDVIDRLNGAENQCGLYGAFLVVDGDTIFGQKTNQISFENSRYINSHRDLSAMGSHYHKSFRNCSNPLEIYVKDANLGVISLFPGNLKNVEYITYDPHGNKTILTFALKVADGEMAPNYNPEAEKYWYPEEPREWKTANWEVIADSFTIYEPYALSKTSTPHLCDVSTSLQKRYTVRMKLANPKLPIEKYYLGVGGSSKRAIPTTYKDGWLEGKTNYAGTAAIFTDEVAPSIKPSFSGTAVKTKILKWNISDGQSGLANYSLFIDDVWHLLEYEYKGSYAFCELPDQLYGDHSFKVVVTDACGNTATWEQVLTFPPQPELPSQE